MPLDNLVCGLIETGINKLQQLDSSASKKRKQLAGHVIAVSFKELNKPLYFIISTQQIDILNEYEGPVDCFIRLNILALADLQNNHQLTHLIKTEQLEVEGDIQLAQQFALLLTEMQIDWEEHLASKVGDLLAHKLCYLLKKGQQSASLQLQTIEKHSALFITEELKLAPNALQVAHFCDQVTDIQKQLDSLDNRLNQLTQ